MVRVVVRLIVVLRASIDIPNVLGAAIDVVPTDVPDVHLPDSEVVRLLEERGRHLARASGIQRKEKSLGAVKRSLTGWEESKRWGTGRATTGGRSKGRVCCSWLCWLWALINASWPPHGF